MPAADEGERLVKFAAIAFDVDMCYSSDDDVAISSRTCATFALPTCFMSQTVITTEREIARGQPVLSFDGCDTRVGLTTSRGTYIVKTVQFVLSALFRYSPFLLPLHKHSNYIFVRVGLHVDLVL